MSTKTEQFHSISFPDQSLYDETFLQHCIQNRIQAIRFDGPESYLQELNRNGEERMNFQKTLQVSYSEFFRNSLTFSVLEKVVLPELIHRAHRDKRTKLRIWSMACASGQEAYSLAILLEECLEQQSEAIEYQLFASDQSASEIECSSEGCYSKNDMANVNLKRLDRWFLRKNDGYVVKQELRRNIHFSVFDVVSNPQSCPPDSIFGEFDLIFCANLLFYYKAESQDTILHKAETALSKGGYLVTGEVERSLVRQRLFKEHYPHSAIFQKNTDNSLSK